MQSTEKVLEVGAGADSEAFSVFLSFPAREKKKALGFASITLGKDFRS